MLKKEIKSNKLEFDILTIFLYLYYNKSFEKVINMGNLLDFVLLPHAHPLAHLNQQN